MEDGWENIDVRCDVSRNGAGEIFGEFVAKGNFCLPIVEVGAVKDRPFFEKFFCMIAGEDAKRFVVKALFLEVFKKLSDQMVDPMDGIAIAVFEQLDDLRIIGEREVVEFCRVGLQGAGKVVRTAVLRVRGVEEDNEELAFFGLLGIKRLNSEAISLTIFDGKQREILNRVDEFELRSKEDAVHGEIVEIR